MDKIWIIIQREYITRVKRRAFIITTLLAPLGFLLLLSASVLINTYSQTRTDVAIVDETGLFKDIPIPDAEDQTVYFHKVSEPYSQAIQMLPKGKNGGDGKYQAIIYIPANFNIDNPTQIAYRSVQRPGNAKKEFINQRFSTVIQQLRMKKLNISSDELEKARRPVELNFESLEHSKESKGYTDAATIAGLVMGFAIYLSLLFYGTMIMRGVMEEKTNRIVEVLTSSVKPFQLLMGKILGVGAVGLTQFILWILLTGAVNIFVVPILGSHVANTGNLNTMHNSIDPDSIEAIRQNIGSLPITEMAFLCPIYFLGGFLLYGALFAAIGAAMGEDSDQQSLVLPVMVPIIISVIIAGSVLNNPDSNLGFWGSVIPFTSPVVMCTLIPFQPQWWQIVISVLLLIGGFILTTLLAARIYRVGILMYGKKVSLKEMGRWIFAKG